MDNEKNGVNMDTDQARQFFTVAVEQAVTKALEQVVIPKFDEQNLKMQEQDRKMEEQGIRLEEQGISMKEQSRRMEEQGTRLEEQNSKMEELRTDMRIAISESNTARLKGTIAISGLITGFGSAIAIGVSAIIVSILK
ncbi:hypothetical protein [Thioalkalivibrio sp. HK1]|uniref:hypothetical protein n=1 Tax=Thioalkalivibrio sp. HK1 TaxID=1469245 RepID=UPI000470BA77|nr:hypothetical protein [Thioalkalivibrio sp. HK1]